MQQFYQNQQKHSMTINWLYGIDSKDYCMCYYFLYIVCYTFFASKIYNKHIYTQTFFPKILVVKHFPVHHSLYATEVHKMSIIIIFSDNINNS